MTEFKAVLFGGSAGAIEVLKKILPHLPKAPEDRTYAVICVLHLLPKGPSLLPTIFRDVCDWPVKEAESTEVIEPGYVYFAPADYHLGIETDHTFSLSNEEPLMYSRPSIDLLFETAATAYKRDLVAILLSGANADGSRGFVKILKHGGRCLTQTPESAEFPEMPVAALEVSSAVEAMNPDAIVEFLNGRS